MNLYVGKDLNEALDKAADAENVDIEYLQYRIIRESETEVEIEAYFVADVIDYVKGYLNTVLTNMGLTVELSAKYEGEVINVAEFIDATLAEDEHDFENLSYRKVYEEYFRMYDEGLSQQQIQTRLLNSPDPEIMEVAKDLLIEKHTLTVANYEKSMTSVSTLLVQFVPKALMIYQVKKLDKMISDLMTGLSSNIDLEAQVETLTKITDLTRTRTMLNNELGRV